MRLLAGSIRPSSQLPRHDQALGWGFGKALAKAADKLQSRAETRQQSSATPAGLTGQLATSNPLAKHTIL